MKPSGIYEPEFVTPHKDLDFDERAFATLLEMQESHFWYLGRHKFIKNATTRHILSTGAGAGMSVVDLGGGVGGWLSYLCGTTSNNFARVALADSSRVALDTAAGSLPCNAERYLIDLMNLGWSQEWDLAFMLDVIEHLDDDVVAVQEASRSLKSGGHLVITTPALPMLWSYNDETAGHKRRYTVNDYRVLADVSNMEVVDARYFMFLLSPLYVLSRYKPAVKLMTHEQKRELAIAQHKIPPLIINKFLSKIFGLETPLGHFLRFPWGTSVIAILRKK